MTALAQRHNDRIRRWKADGKPTAVYACPACKQDIERSRPYEPTETWTTLTQCPHCADIHHVTVPAAGAVRVIAL